MKSQIIIPLEGFPETGLRCCGEVDSSILELENTNLQCAGPVLYDLEAHLYDTELVIRGCASVPFLMRCERCLSEFTHTVQVDKLMLSYQVQDEPSLDITEDVREELILALPAYPKCELSGKECQINDIIDDFRLDKAPSTGVDFATPSGESVWQALDKFPGSQPK